jgi:hypothetical protein
MSDNSTKNDPTQNYRMPSESTMKNAVKLAIVDDKPIILDYWTCSLDKKALIGQRDNGDKLLVKAEDEYTSIIQKFYKVGSDFIVITENSIYIVDSGIQIKKIS